MYELFNEVENKALRAYNRAVMCVNLKADVGENEARKYLENFNEEDKKGIAAILMGIKGYGAEAVKQVIINVSNKLA